jgi:hypothetical protein
MLLNNPPGFCGFCWLAILHSKKQRGHTLDECHYQPQLSAPIHSNLLNAKTHLAENRELV